MKSFKSDTEVIEYFNISLDLVNKINGFYPNFFNLVIEKYPNAEPVKWFICFLTVSCIYGILNIGKLLIDLVPDSIEKMDCSYNFQICCQYGNLEMAKWVKGTFKYVDVHRNGELPFRSACANGHLHIANWLCSSFPDIDIYNCQFHAFLSACRNGHLPIVIWLFNKSDSTYLQTKAQSFFMWACYNGHLKVIKFLIDKFSNIDVHYGNDNVFRCTCGYGHLNVVKWLFNNYPEINIHAHNDDAFKQAFYNGRIKIVNWMVNKFHFYNFNEYEALFRNACYRNDVDACLIISRLYPEIYEKLKDPDQAIETMFTFISKNNPEFYEWIIRRFINDTKEKNLSTNYKSIIINLSEQKIVTDNTEIDDKYDEYDEKYDNEEDDCDNYDIECVYSECEFESDDNTEVDSGNEDSVGKESIDEIVSIVEEVVDDIVDNTNNYDDVSVYEFIDDSDEDEFEYTEEYESDEIKEEEVEGIEEEVKGEVEVNGEVNRKVEVEGMEEEVKEVYVNGVVDEEYIESSCDQSGWGCIIA